MALFYRHKIGTSAIRAALKKLSTAFWPLFGEHHTGQIQFDGYSEGDCFDEVICSHEYNPDAAAAELFEAYSKFNPVTLKKLFRLQIVQYTNGTVLIPKLNHLAGDGYSYFYFLSVLAVVARGKNILARSFISPLILRPRHDRTILKEFLFSAAGFTSARPEPPAIKYIIRFEEVSRAEIYQDIKDVKTRFDASVSTNDLLAARALQKLVGLQDTYFSGSVALTMPMDVRRQIAAYGRKYFGNALQFARQVFEMKTVRESDRTELARQIRRNVPVITREKYLKYLQSLESFIDTKQWAELRPFDPQRGCLVTNLTKMPLNELDFGSGRPDIIFPLTIEKNSAALLTRGDNYVLRLAY